MSKSLPRSASKGVSRRHIVVAAVAAAASTPARAQSTAGSGASAHLRFHNPKGRPSQPGFTQGVEAIGPGRIIYVSGQQGLDADGKVVSADFEEQVVAAFENMKAILADAGASFDHGVKLNHYFIDMR